jgi:hypothetical protein
VKVFFDRKWGEKNHCFNGIGTNLKILVTGASGFIDRQVRRPDDIFFLDEFPIQSYLF